MDYSFYARELACYGAY